MDLKVQYLLKATVFSCIVVGGSLTSWHKGKVAGLPLTPTVATFQLFSTDTSKFDAAARQQ